MNVYYHFWLSFIFALICIHVLKHKKTIRFLSFSLNGFIFDLIILFYVENMIKLVSQAKSASKKKSLWDQKIEKRVKTPEMFKWKLVTWDKI